MLLVLWSHQWQMNGNAVGIAAVKIAAAKAELPFWEAFFNGILCNILVCLAVGLLRPDAVWWTKFSRLSSQSPPSLRQVRAQRCQHVLLQEQLPTTALSALDWAG